MGEGGGGGIALVRHNTVNTDVQNRKSPILGDISVYQRCLSCCQSNWVPGKGGVGVGVGVVGVHGIIYVRCSRQFPLYTCKYQTRKKKKKKIGTILISQYEHGAWDEVHLEKLPVCTHWHTKKGPRGLQLGPIEE